MAQYEVSVDEEIFHELFSGNEEGMQKLLTQVLNQVLEEQRTEHLQADHHERSDDRKGYRNGYTPRKIATRVGTLTLRVPRVRNGDFSPEMFERYQRSEQALVLSLMEMVINGVSTRKVKKVTEELCGTSFSKSTVSRLCAKLDPIVESWNNRPLNDKRYPFLIVDGLVLKVRENDRVVPRSALIAIGVNEDGYREILGLQMGHSETYESWKRFFERLNERRLNGVDVVVSDDHKGLKKAAREVFQDTIWQRCQFHSARNILDQCPKRYRQDLKHRLKEIHRAPDKARARQRCNETIADYDDKAPKAMNCLENGLEDAIAVLELPTKYRRRLRTTNSLERLNQEIRRRDKVIRIYPNERSAWRLVGALLMEQHEEWSTGRRYFDMEEYEEWKQESEQTEFERTPMKVMTS